MSQLPAQFGAVFGKQFSGTDQPPRLAPGYESGGKHALRFGSRLREPTELCASVGRLRQLTRHGFRLVPCGKWRVARRVNFGGTGCRRRACGAGVSRRCRLIGQAQLAEVAQGDRRFARGLLQGLNPLRFSKKVNPSGAQAGVDSSQFAGGCEECGADPLRQRPLMAGPIGRQIKTAPLNCLFNLRGESSRIAAGNAGFGQPGEPLRTDRCRLQQGLARNEQLIGRSQRCHDIDQPAIDLQQHQIPRAIDGQYASNLVAEILSG